MCIAKLADKLKLMFSIGNRKNININMNNIPITGILKELKETTERKDIRDGTKNIICTGNTYIIIANNSKISLNKNNVIL